jgi:hypothetical protein
MPRPAHYRQRQEALVKAAGETPLQETGKKVADPVSSAAGEAGELDGTDNTRQPSSRSGRILPEAVDAESARSVARLMGWVPKEEWKRDPSKWTDAADFLADQPRKRQELESRFRGLSAAAERAQEEQRARDREEAQREVREAAVKADPEAAARAAQKLASASGPLPEVAAWRARNPWFQTDEVATALAQAESARLHKLGKSTSEQLEGVETLMRSRFPELYGLAQSSAQSSAHAGERGEPQEPADRPLRHDPPRREPPNIAEGQRGGAGGRDRPKGWNDVPAADRAQLSSFVKKMVGRGRTQADAEAALATTYWENKG